MRLNVGDLAVVTASKFFPESVGEIVTIIDLYQERVCRLPDGAERRMFRYLVRRADGSQGACSFRNLEPLRSEPGRPSKQTRKS